MAEEAPAAQRPPICPRRSYIGAISLAILLDADRPCGAMTPPRLPIAADAFRIIYRASMEESRQARPMKKIYAERAFAASIILCRRRAARRVKARFHTCRRPTLVGQLKRFATRQRAFLKYD